ncbi:hypothetical protein BU24DRAFT_346488 [Aaosphaeria arxii CBS 175.79]|uniref:Cation/H+ exchanger transmembrane domain-containing protein n=1 Tax=Aaosphaeria arxii CBS 175.79 TaxID=1450172 RepID=A0A6A5XU27_9PLEO|nr:uncharacterized protein BU24DRAFT_346488 [Aaosphaeria arxii CBS 175.79]KAF2016426.1 hypothetical protein BU24DRAFT_346488 [Aaosphaeria arxii CBS 175.79]
MPTLAVVNFNIVCATLGGFITVFGLVSYLFKEKFYLSEPLISLVAGVIFSPHATNLIRPLEYALGDVETLDTITLYFTRLVLGVQLVLAGVQLPSKYLKTEWKSLALLLGPGMTIMWLSTSLLVFAFVPHIQFLQALAVGACVTPTDPVLSNSIVKGKFADKNIPKELQKIIIAESGANDGLGYPFLFLPLYLILHVGYGGLGQDHSTSRAIGDWFGETWGYVIILSVVYGATVGWIAKEILHWAKDRNYIDRESFLVFAIALALFIVGTVGLVGSDDVLACFIAGNTFTWDDWFRLETLDDSFQPTIDMLLNVTIFIWFGAVCPWPEFAHNSVIPIYRLIFLGILVLLLRRPPIVYAMHKWIHQIEEKRQAIYTGFFGPIGVSAVFYLYVSLDFLRHITVDGEIRPDAKFLMEVMNVVVWFLCVCSVIIHGLSVPLGKLGIYLPRTISNALSSDLPEGQEPFHVQQSNDNLGRELESPGSQALPYQIRRIGRSIIRPKDNESSSNPGSGRSTPVPARSTGGVIEPSAVGRNVGIKTAATTPGGSDSPSGPVQRTIRFPEDVDRTV